MSEEQRPPAQNSGSANDPLLHKYGALDERYRAMRRNFNLALLFIMMAFCSPVIAILSVLFAGNSSYVIAIPLVIWAVISLIIAGRFSARARTRTFQVHEVTAIKTYLAYTSILTNRIDNAIVSIRSVLVDVSEWKGRKAPLFISTPSDGLGQTLRNNAIRELSSGRTDNRQRIATALYNLLSILDQNSSLGTVAPVIEALNSFTPAPAKKRDWQIKARVKRIRALTQNKIILLCIIGSALLIAFGAGWFYLLPPMIGEEPVTLEMRLNGVLAAFGGFVALIGGIAVAIIVRSLPHATKNS